MDRPRPLNKLPRSVGRAKAKHRGEGSSGGQENRALPMESSSSDVPRRGEPRTNAGCNKQPVDTRRRAGNSVVREQEVQESDSQDDDSFMEGMESEEEVSGEGRSSASGGSEDGERRSGGGDEERCGHGDVGDGSKRKSAWEDKEAGEGSSNRNQRRKISIKILPPNPNPPPHMPREFKNAGRNKQPVDTRRRAGNSVVREQEVQESDSQDDDSLTEGMESEEEVSGEGGSLAYEVGEDKEWGSGGDEERSGHSDSGDGSKRKSGWEDKEAGEGSSNRNQRRKISIKILPPNPNPPPRMPREFKDKINGLGGKDVTLVMEKVIQTSDLSSKSCRLSLPKNQFKEMGFLREEERRKLDARGEIPVRVILPNLLEKDLIFTLWEMRKKSKRNAKKAKRTHRKDGKNNRKKRAKRAKTAHDSDEDSETEQDGTKECKSSFMYILRTGWRGAAKESKLHVDDRCHTPNPSQKGE